MIRRQLKLKTYKASPERLVDEVTKRNSKAVKNAEMGEEAKASTKTPTLTAVESTTGVATRSCQDSGPPALHPLKRNREANSAEDPSKGSSSKRQKQ